MKIGNLRLVPFVEICGVQINPPAKLVSEASAPDRGRFRVEGHYPLQAALAGARD